MVGRRLAGHALACALVLAAPAAAPAGSDGPRLDVDVVVGDDLPVVKAWLDVRGAGAAGKITLDVPRGFGLGSKQGPGRTIGTAQVYAFAAGFGASGKALLRGPIVAAVVDEAAEAEAQSCSPVAHAAIWRLELTLLGQPLAIPVYVSAAGAVTRIEVCSPALATPDGSAGRLLPIVHLSLSLPGYRAPTARGNYVWRAFVAPLAPGRRAVRGDKAFEVRATVPVPHRLTLRGRYVAKTKRVVLEGRLIANGAPRKGVLIRVERLSRRITADGVVFDDTTAGWAWTRCDGTYVLRTWLDGTTGFRAAAQGTRRKCVGKSTAPGGCRSETVSATRSEPVTVAP
jgi:hypothetical protein